MLMRPAMHFFVVLTDHAAAAGHDVTVVAHAGSSGHHVLMGAALRSLNAHASTDVAVARTTGWRNLAEAGLAHAPSIRKKLLIGAALRLFGAIGSRSRDAGAAGTEPEKARIALAGAALELLMRTASGWRGA